MALGQAGFISKPGLCASDLVLIDLVQGRLNYCNGSLHHPIPCVAGGHYPAAGAPIHLCSFR